MTTIRLQKKISLPAFFAALGFTTMLLAGTAANAALNLSAVANVDTARSGELLTLEFTVSNTGPNARTGVVLTLLYPANLNQAAESEFDGDCPSTTCSAGETVTWTLGSIAAGEAVMLELPVIVAGNTANGTVIAFDPLVTDDTVETATASAPVTVNNATLYDIHLSENADPAIAGSELRYQISFGYREDAQAVNNSLLTFALPAGTTFVSASDGGSLNGSTVEWPLGFLTPGVQGAREVRVMLDGGLDAGTVIDAVAGFSSVSSPAERIGSGAATAIASAQPLSVAIESAANPLREAELANLQYTVSNNDPFTRIGVTLTSRYPQGFNSAAETEFDGDCASTTCSAGERIIWTLGDIPAGESVTVDLIPVVATSPLVDGIVTPLFAKATDAFGATARTSSGVRLQTASLYDLALAEDADPVTADSLLTYKLSFAYPAPAAGVSNTRLLFELPQGVSFVSATEGGAFSNGGVEWALGFLAPGDSGIREVTVQVDTATAAATILRARAQVLDVATPLSGVTAEANTAVAAAASLGLDLEVNPSPARVSEMVQVQLTITNRDAFTRFGVDLAARFPQGAGQLAEAEFAGNCGSTTCTTGERVTWALGNILGGESITVDFPPVISAGVVDGSIVNFFAWVEDDAGGHARLQDSATIDSGAVYDLSLAENADPAAAGGELTYMLTYGYREEAAAVTNSTLRFVVPAGASFVSATGGGVANDGVVEWPLGFMSPGDGGLREVTVLLDSELAEATVVSAHADLFSVTAPDSRLRAEAETVIATGAPLQLHIETNPGVARDSVLSNYQLTVANLDSFTRFGVQLTTNFPQAYAQLAESEFNGDCGSTTCTATEKVTWTVGNIAAGGAVTVDFPPVLGTRADGELVNLFVTAVDDQGAQSRQLETIRMQNDSNYSVSLAEDTDPATAGSLIDYSLTFGYREDAAMVTDSVMRFKLPAGTSFVSASDGGVPNGEVVEWPLGFLSPGDGDLRTVTVQADAGLAAGTVLEASAEIFAAADGVESARSEANTIIAAGVPLTLALLPNRNNAEAGEPLSLLLSVTNNDAFTRFGVSLNARFPQLLSQLSENNFTGDCASTTCTPGERVNWLLGNIVAGDTVTVELPPIVSDVAPDGVLINFYAAASDDQNAQAQDIQSLLLGCLDSIDTDCDGISDVDDNCLVVQNLSQRDTDIDGIGNYCDADLTGDCQINFLDLGALKAVFFSDDENADFNGDGDVNFIDLGIMKGLFFGSPGPSGIPNACD